MLRSRIVARDFKSADRPDLCARTPPLEALKAIISIAASHSPEFSLMHVDVSCAYFHAKAQEARAGEIGSRRLLKEGSRKNRIVESMYGTRDAASNWERDGNGISKIGATCWGAVQEVRFTETTSWWQDRRRVCWSLRSSWRACIQSKASIIGAGSAKSIKALSRRICWYRDIVPT